MGRRKKVDIKLDSVDGVKAVGVVVPKKIGKAKKPTRYAKFGEQNGRN
jgi:hypothetical protein